MTLQPLPPIARAAALICIGALLISGCARTRNTSTQTESTSTPAPATAPAQATNQPAPKPAPAASQPAAKPAASGTAQSKVPPGMNERGEVVDSSKLQAGTGQKVKGINNWEGEISGKPGANSQFTRLQIGMSMRQVVDLVGQPTDQGAYITGKAFIPFYYGSDRHRHEMVYKGQGRLVFAGTYSGGNLIWIIHNPNEGGYR